MLLTVIMKPKDVLRLYYCLIDENKKKYKCTLCGKIYVKNITRMCKHASQCPTAREDTRLWTVLGRAIICSGNALSSIENYHWSEVFKQWNRSCPLSTEKELSEVILKKEYEDIKTKISEKVLHSFAYGLKLEYRDSDEIIVYITAPETFMYSVLRVEKSFKADNLDENKKYDR